MYFERGCGVAGIRTLWTQPAGILTPPGSRRMYGDKKKVIIDPKERGLNVNVIIMMYRQNLANFLGEHIR
jgi:hypothetical protein